MIMTVPPAAGRYGSGHAVQRIEDAALLAGHAARWLARPRPAGAPSDVP
jgi:hypothetical protein